MVDIARDPRWGRIAEGCGEDPYITSVMARAMVEGFQGKVPMTRLDCCVPKTFCWLWSCRRWTHYNSTLLPERLLRKCGSPSF
jgi:beta-glucosidase